ncbi:MAG: hypothetical protein GX046_10505 [Tissierellia bacterium]|nr:hypothetical protein [Tissierellia bacterium]
MLKELSLRNYLLLDDLHLEFSPGFCVITGETGSGKSVLLEGLRILLGQSVTKEELRNPQEKAYFELIYEDEDEILALSREVFPSGRSVSRLNGEIINLNQVRTLFDPKIDFYGQRDDSLLLHRHHQQRLLFNYGKEEIKTILEEIKNFKDVEKKIQGRLEELRELSQLEKEALEHQYKELENLHLNLEKDLELEENFDEILHGREILQGLQTSKELLDNEILRGLYRLEDEVLSMRHFSRHTEIHSRLQGLRYELEDLREELGDALTNIDVDEEFIRQKEERFRILMDIKKKYQRDIKELIEYKEEIEKILNNHRHQNEIREELKKEHENNLKAYHKSSKKLLEISQKQFLKMTQGLKEVLKFLELEQAEFSLEMEEKDSEEIYLDGHFRLSFLASMNKGALRPMANILSGGEMSRLMLALKSVLSSEEELMIFDEIDTGISGRVAHQVGKQIHHLSKTKQIIAISHLPQVVAFSDEHFFLEKNLGRTTVKKLSTKEHEEALATMMSGQLNEASLETARKMIFRAKGE